MDNSKLSETKTETPTKFQKFCSSVFAQLAIAIAIFYFVSLFDTKILVFELLSHFQVGFLFFFVLCLFVGLKAKHKWLIGVSTICFLITVYHLLPFYYFQETKHSNQPLISIYQYNVETGNINIEAVKKQIDGINPDIVLLIETDSEWRKIISELKLKYPFSDENAIGAFGYVFLSKYEIKAAEAAIFKNQFKGLKALLNINGTSVRFLGLHPPPPVNTEAMNMRNQILNGVAELISQDPQTPTIVCGDLNVTPWSPDYKKMVIKANLLNSRYGNGILPSWPSRFFYQIPIDHCLYTPHFATASVEILADKGSDHLPVLNKLFLK